MPITSIASAAVAAASGDRRTAAASGAKPTPPPPATSPTMPGQAVTQAESGKWVDQLRHVPNLRQVQQDKVPTKPGDDRATTSNPSYHLASAPLARVQGLLLAAATATAGPVTKAPGLMLPMAPSLPRLQGLLLAKAPS
ncbi:hypothetical protein ABBQ38_007580 [Trebouxia sp. C0009 RCD-2024]